MLPTEASVEDNPEKNFDPYFSVPSMFCARQGRRRASLACTVHRFVLPFRSHNDDNTKIIERKFLA